MKNLQNVLTGLVLCGLLFLINSKLNGQSKISVSAGMGLIELANIGVHYNSGNIQTGIRYGMLPSSQWNNPKSLTLDLAYHILGSAKLSDRRPWYIKGSLNFSMEKEESTADKYTMASLKVGREFNINRKFAFFADVGPVFLLSHSSTKIGGEKWFEGYNENFSEAFFLLPSTSLGVSYKF